MKQYLSEFDGRKTPKLSSYWQTQDTIQIPDAIIYSLMDDYPTYSMGNHFTIYYANLEQNTIHLKTLITKIYNFSSISVVAITNHYVSFDLNKQPYFIAPMQVQHTKYKRVSNRNITYHFPITHIFDRLRSDLMIKKLEFIEQKWEFKPVPIEYYFADNMQDLLSMKGLDYLQFVYDKYPSGISFPSQKVIYCQGLGEGYLHEVLHMYFNPLYGTSPICHGLIYYLGGTSGMTFNQYIKRTYDYLQKHPEINLSDFQTLQIHDNLITISYAVLGMLCKLIDSRGGVKEFKRVLSYKTIDEIFEKEFGLKREEWDKFLKENFKKYSS